MNQKRAEIDITTLAYVAKAPSVTAGVFTGCDTQIAGEAASGGETLDVADKGHECRRREQTYAWDGAQAHDQRALPGHFSELLFNIEDINSLKLPATLLFITPSPALQESNPIGHKGTRRKPHGLL